MSCTKSRSSRSPITNVSRDIGSFDETLTAPGCGMGGMIAGQARQRILDNIDSVEEATVDLVWDPPWEPSMMSEEARQKLGIG
jgi:metal-sulfur cluster biosynthetic enzyme